MNGTSAQTPPTSRWYTEEILDKALNAARDRWVTGSSDSTQMLLSVEAALDAIAPMVTKWVGDLQASEGEMMRQAGYEAGHRKGYRAGRMFGYEEGVKAGQRQPYSNPDDVLRSLGFKG